MARRFKAPGRSGPTVRMPWSDGAWPADWSGTRRGRRKHKRGTPRAGGRTGPKR